MRIQMGVLQTEEEPCFCNDWRYEDAFQFILYYKSVSAILTFVNHKQNTQKKSILNNVL